MVERIAERLAPLFGAISRLVLRPSMARSAPRYRMFRTRSRTTFATQDMRWRWAAWRCWPPTHSVNIWDERI